MNEHLSILVTGASGNTGSALVTSLLAQGAKVRAASRSGQPDTQDNLLATSVRFDWFDPATYHQTLQGIERMYLVPPPGVLDPLPVMMPFLTGARQAGVRRVVLLSATVIQRGDTGLGQVHDALPDLFPEWAVLRPSWFMQNFVGQHPHAYSIREQGILRSATGNGRVGFINAEDIARTAAHILLSETPPNRDLLLTGPEAISYDEVAQIMSSVRTNSVRHQHVSVDELQQLHIDSGLPPEFAEMLAQADHLIAGGMEDRVTNEVEAVTGTPPTSFKDFVTQYCS
ncbi:NAD(P)H-binding protein [Paenibacillus daejeonensis]|uniref:NAD(P)H-binding protein n=1 Tax=Paenibacillus daejeonensis TaxID=135193 RepID=UPI0003666D4D|nr:NAD(P)H-binding protein [Paenibacillus daejeonensis]